MGLAPVFAHQPGLPSIPSVAPIVFVIDDDIFGRRSLELLIHREGFHPETFESAQEFLVRPRSFLPSCLILALSSRNPNGLAAQKQIARERAEIPIIIVSSDEDIPTTVQAMKAGAVDFLLKPYGSGVLVAAIRQSLERSRIALDRELEIRDLRNNFADLTPRERQVMALVVSGLLNKQIGAELSISEVTVKAHRGQVMQKMKANSLAGLVRMAAKLHAPRHTLHLA